MGVADLVVSTVVFFAASYFVKRWADDNDLPKGMTRGALVFTLALVAAYGADWIVSHIV
jgi:hypothetical protein